MGGRVNRHSRFGSEPRAMTTLIHINSATIQNGTIRVMHRDSNKKKFREQNFSDQQMIFNVWCG